jgi:hypothetical protein
MPIMQNAMSASRWHRRVSARHRGRQAGIEPWMERTLDRRAVQLDRMYAACGIAPHS